jgi:SNF2 family DNA or RNA helicase
LKHSDLQDGGVILPARDVYPEELEFDAVERKFYDDLLQRGQETLEELKNSRGGLGSNYMSILTMLLRLRQATDHIDLLKGKVDDMDAQDDKPPPAPADDDLVSMMGGLGIETKCSLCFKMYLLSITLLTKYPIESREMRRL